MNPSLQLVFDEIRRKFDEFDARWERRFTETRAARGQRDSAVDLRVGNPERYPAAQFEAPVVADDWGGLFEQPAHISVPNRAAAVGADVAADNWGGLFDGDSIEQYSVPPPIVADNWGGLFEQPAHISEERVLDLSAPDAAFGSVLSGTADEAASTDQWFVDALNAPAPHPIFGLDTASDEPSPGPAAARAQADAAETPSCHAAALAKASPAHLAPGAPRPSLKYQLPQDDLDLLISVTSDDVVAYGIRIQIHAVLHQAFVERLRPCTSATPHADFLTAVAAGPDPPRVALVVAGGAIPVNAALLEAVTSLSCVVTLAARVIHIDLVLCARRGIVVAGAGEIFSVDIADPAVELLVGMLRRFAVADRYGRAGLWPAQGIKPEASDPPPDTRQLLQLVVPEEEAEVPSTLPNRCSMNGLILIQRCFSLPSCCRWDAVLHRQHRPWPPPTELRLVSWDAGLRPLPWPSFNMVERNSVTCHFGRLWKPPWYVPIQQTVRCVLADLVEYWKHWSSYVHKDEMMWISFTWEGCSDFSLPHITTRYAAAHVHILSAFVSLLASPKWCDQSKLLVLTVSKLSSSSTLLHTFTAPVFAPAAVQALRIRCSLLARIPRNDSLMQLKRGGITQWKLCHLLLSGPRVLIFAEDSSRHASCGSIRLHDTGSFERKAQIHISCSTVCLASCWCFAQCVHVAFLPVKWSAQLLVLGGMKCLYISLHAQQEQAIISVPIWRMLTALDNCNIHSLSLSWECFSEVKEAVGIHWWKREGVLHGDGIRVCVTFQGILTYGFTEDKKTIQYITIHTPQLLKSEAEASWLICIKSQKLLWGPGDNTLCFGDSESHDYSSDMKVMLATKYFVKKIWRLDGGNITEDANASRTFSLYGTYGGLKTVFGKIKAHCKQVHSGAYAVPALCQKTIVMHRLVDANLLEASATSALGYSVHAKSESIELDLQVPWDPGDLYLHLQTLVHWLEGKPILKEEGMSVHCQVGPGCQDSCSNDTKGDRSAGGGHQRLFRKT